MIEIWSPRYHDRKVLIAKYKVVSGRNDIRFTKAKSLKDKMFSIEGSEIIKYPLETNGTIQCYAVDLDKLLEKELK